MHYRQNRQKFQRKKVILSKTPLGKENQRLSSEASKRITKTPEQRGNLCQKLKKPEKVLKPNIITQYEIKQDNLENNRKFRQMERKYEKRMQKQQKEWLKRLEQKRGISLSKSNKGLGSTQKGSNEKTESKQKYQRRRYTIITRRPQTQKKFSSDPVKRKEMKSPVKINIVYEKQNKRLREEAEKYKKLYEQCLKALGNMDNYIREEKDKHVLEKKILIEEVLKYESQMKSQSKIGHLYSYKDFNPQNLLPQSVIVENLDENNSSIPPVPIQKYEKIMKEYLQKQSHSNSRITSNLSLESK